MQGAESREQYLIQSVALLSRSGCPTNELQAMSSPRDTSLTPAGDGGGQRVMRD